jgi:hypothetical protein
MVCVAAGCAASQAEVPLVVFDLDATGTKMLRPNARATACRTRILGHTIAGDASPLDASLRSLLRLDREADALTRVALTSRLFTLGLFDRSCVTARADVIRTTSVVRLPAPPGHEGHH